MARRPAPGRTRGSWNCPRRKCTVGTVANQAAVGGSKPGPIDPGAGPKWALGGHLVTMDPKRPAVMDGALWIAEGQVAAITQGGDPTPTGFEGIAPLETGGTVFPGLIEL